MHNCQGLITHTVCSQGPIHGCCGVTGGGGGPWKNLLELYTLDLLDI